MKLVICEKPSVGAAVAAALGVTGRKDGYIEGNGYLISWCIGHLVQLSEAAAYGEQYKKWSYDSLPILPQEWSRARTPIPVACLKFSLKLLKNSLTTPP